MVIAPAGSRHRIVGMRVLVVTDSLMLADGLAFTLRSSCGLEVVHTSCLSDVRVTIGADPIAVAVVTWDRTIEAVPKVLASLDGLCGGVPIVILADYTPTPAESVLMSNRVVRIVTKHEPIQAVVDAIYEAAGFDSAEASAAT